MEEKPIQTENEILDVATGILYAGGLEKIYVQVLSIFTRKGKEKRTLIQNLYEEKDWQGYEIEVHALKSTSLTIGAKQLSEQAAEIERFCKNGTYDAIDRYHDRMMENYQRVIDAGWKELTKRQVSADTEKAGQKERESGMDAPQISPESVKEYIRRIKEAAEAFDADEIEQICTEASNYFCGEVSLKEYFGSVREAVNEFEYEEAAALAEEIMEKISKR